MKSFLGELMDEKGYRRGEGADGKRFLWELNERVDTDETDGEHTIHFDGKYEDCEMKVKVVNGKREGKAIVWKGGERYLIVTYRNGVVDGRVERMDGERDVELRGVLVKGVERGLFEEVRELKVVFGGGEEWERRTGNGLVSGCMRME